MVRTVLALLFKPGFLSREYFEGRRAAYVPPLRLYLIASVTFFFLMSAESFFGVSRPMIQLYHPPPNANARIQTANPAQVRKDIGKAIDSLDIGALSPHANQALRTRLKTQALKAQKLFHQDPRSLVNAILNVAPPILFMLVPVFAIFLKLAYLGSGYYYTEHLVFSVHNHSFMFIMFILSAVFGLLGMLWTPLATFGHDLINFWIIVYMYLSLLFYYRQGSLLTLGKFAVLSFVYLIMFGISTALAMVMGIMTL